MTKGFDCATKLNGTSAKNLKNAGFEYAMRYLPTSSWKGLTKEELKSIQGAGLKLVSIFQKSANYAGYFTKAQGRADGKEAQKHAENLGQPKGTMIYFAVDYDCSTSQLKNIDAYFEGVKETLKGYKIGIYGSYRVVNHMEGKVDGYWQTYAWSRGKVAEHIHMHQYQNGVTVAGIQIDRNDIKRNPGAWDESVKTSPKKQPPKKKSKKKRLAKNGKYTIVAGDTLSEIAADFGVTVNQLVQWNNIKDKNLIRTGQVLQVQKPKSQPKQKTTTYKIKTGDTLTGIAKKFGTTVEEIRDLNNITNPNMIYAGDTIKISSKKPVYHKVKAGDTVSALAIQYGSTQSQIKSWNNLKDINKIYVGQKLRVK